MGYTLSTGLSDLSRELNESSVVSDTKRIGHYNDAVTWFCNEKKWQFLLKLNNSKTTSGNSIDISDITDMRQPGGINELYIDSPSNDPWIPIEWERRNQSRYTGGRFIYLSPDEQTLYFKSTPDAGKTVYLWYFHVPARITDTASVATYPIPDRYRKVVATLGAAFVQWSRYLDAKGNTLWNLYNTMVGNVEYQQGERHKNMPKQLPHFLQHKQFKRSYP